MASRSPPPHHSRVLFGAFHILRYPIHPTHSPDSESGVMSPQASSEEKTGEGPPRRPPPERAPGGMKAEALDPAFESFDVVKEAPVFHPTAEEFADPLGYIAKCAQGNAWMRACGSCRRPAVWDWMRTGHERTRRRERSTRSPNHTHVPQLLPPPGSARWPRARACAASSPPRAGRRRSPSTRPRSSSRHGASRGVSPGRWRRRQSVDGCVGPLGRCMRFPPVCVADLSMPCTHSLLSCPSSVQNISRLGAGARLRKDFEMRVRKFMVRACPLI